MAAKVLEWRQRNKNTN